MTLPSQSAVLAKVNAARNGNAVPLRNMVEALSVTGIRYKGQTIRFGYMDLMTLLGKVDVEPGEFEELMQECDYAG